MGAIRGKRLEQPLIARLYPCALSSVISLPLPETDDPIFRYKIEGKTQKVAGHRHYVC